MIILTTPTESRHGRHQNFYYEVPASYQQNSPPATIQVVDIGGGLAVRAVLFGDYLFIGPEGATFPWQEWYGYQSRAAQHSGPEPLVQVEVLGPAHTKVVTREFNWWTLEPSLWSGHRNNKHNQQTLTLCDTYVPSFSEGSDSNISPYDASRVPYAYLNLRLTLPNGEVRDVEFKYRIPRTGAVTVQGDHSLLIEVHCHGMTHQFTESFCVPRDADGSETYMGTDGTPLATLRRHIEGSTIVGGVDALWAAFLKVHHPDDTETPTENIASVYKRKDIAPVLTRLQTEAPLDWTFFRWLHDATTVAGKRNNQLLVAMLNEVGSDYDKLLGALQAARTAAPGLSAEWSSYRPKANGGLPWKRGICNTFPGVAQKIQEIEAKKDFRKAVGLANQAEGLGVTPNKYPLLRAAIEGGHVPITIFNQPKDRGTEGQPVNREFPLWERALGQKGWAKTIYEIAANASSRSTYQRDITPYLMFLFRICKYLDRHAPRPKGKVWAAMPKFVQSETDLEMAEADENTGTVKKRSAMTPVADNETGIVTVPYVALCVTGMRTQWCYSQHYYIFEEGFSDPESKGMVLRDLEPRLNGRDDYGLCYYTLTGTDIARGYPTFLVIFEKRAGQKSPFVHFHRVRPCRSKDKVVTPACNLIEACYQYMAGNIPASDITAQQGDLVFLRCNNDPIAAKAKVEPDPASSPVLVFESHALQSLNPDVSLTLHRSAAKTPGNRLGFVYAPAGFKVGHPEHDHIEGLTEGWYEIRRCKSWEANPKAIWSLTID